MIGRNLAASAALVVCFQITSAAQAGDAALLVAQAAAPATAPAATSNPAPDQSATTSAKPETASAPDAATKPKARSVLAVPACSVRYVGLKIAGKLNGRKWKDFRRDECGLGDINAVFPDAIAPKYSKETPGKQRFKTCDDQYNANKATNSNGGLKWIQKGGGYYSECNKKLKG